MKSAIAFKTCWQNMRQNLLVALKHHHPPTAEDVNNEKVHCKQGWMPMRVDNMALVHFLDDVILIKCTLCLSVKVLKS